MRTKTTAAALALCAAALLPGAASAQTQGSAPPAVRTDEAPTAGTPQPGSNSFTEGQARSRMEDAGFRDVSDLQKDDQGIWRGRATRNGSPGGVALDFHGNVFGGAAAATPAVPPAATARRATRPARPRVAPRTARRHGHDRRQPGRRQAGRRAGQPAEHRGRAGGGRAQASPAADGTPGNPPGTAAAARRTARSAPTTGANRRRNAPSR